VPAVVTAAAPDVVPADTAPFADTSALPAADTPAAATDVTPAASGFAWTGGAFTLGATPTLLPSSAVAMPPSWHAPVATASSPSSGGRRAIKGKARVTATPGRREASLPFVTPPVLASAAVQVAGSTETSHADAVAAAAGVGAVVHITLGLPLSAADASPDKKTASSKALARLRAVMHAAAALAAAEPLPSVLAAPAGMQAVLANAEALYAAPGLPSSSSDVASTLSPTVPMAECGAAVWTLEHDLALAAAGDANEQNPPPGMFGGMFGLSRGPTAWSGPLSSPLLAPFPVAQLRLRGASQDAFVALLLSVLCLLPLGCAPEDAEEDVGAGAGTVAALAPLLRLVRRSHHAPLLAAQRERAANDRYREGRPTLHLDRRPDSNAGTVLEQVARVCGSRGGAFFHPAGSRWWSVQFVEEAGVDAGGPFRESISFLADELMCMRPGAALSPPLLVPAPNAGDDMGTRKADTVLQPGPLASPPALLRFVGRLMAGAVLSSEETLPLSLTPFTWHMLATGRAPTSLDAFRSVDLLFVNTLRQMASDGETWSNDADEFAFTFAEQTFTITRSDGVVVPLHPGGESRVVTPDSRHEYVAAAAAARREESAAATAALRAGLLDVLPPQLLALWPPAALERAVCGDPAVDVEALRRCTDSGGVSSAVATFFWGAVQRMTHRQRSELLRFATGRQRLPVSLHLSGLSCDGTHLPKASSCSMTLLLPNYTTEDQCLEKMLKACELCLEMDNR
jgi:hypothetical protein